MTSSLRRRMVRRLDVFIAVLLITSAVAAVLFGLHYVTEDEDQSSLVTLTSTITLTATSSATPTPTSTPSAPPSLTPTATATLTPTWTSTPTAVPTATLTVTPTATATSWPVPVVAPLSLGEYLRRAVGRLTGTAQPGDTIQVYDQDQPVGSAVAGADGTWMVELAAGLAEGYHVLSVVAVSPDGSTSAVAPVGFQVLILRRLQRLLRLRRRLH